MASSSVFFFFVLLMYHSCLPTLVTSDSLEQLILDFLTQVIQRPTVLVGNSVGSLACVIAAAGLTRTWLLLANTYLTKISVILLHFERNVLIDYSYHVLAQVQNQRQVG